MEKMRIIHLVNDWTCFLLGYLFNCTLLWLIIRRTEVGMRPYRSILLLATLVDLVYLAVYVMVVPVRLLEKGVGGGEGWVSLVSLGPLDWLPQPYAFAMMALWLFLFFFAHYSLCIPFAYRYMLLCRQHSGGAGDKARRKWGLRHFLAMLAVPTAICLALIYLAYYLGYNRDHFVYSYALDGNNAAAPNSSSIISTAATSNHIYHARAAFLTSKSDHNVLATCHLAWLALDYLLIFAFTWLIHRYLRREAANNSAGGAHLLEISKQVDRTLLLQALVPLVGQSGPAFLIGALTTWAGYMGISGDGAYATAIFAWGPVVNPLITIWVVQAYRRECANWWCRCWRRLASPSLTFIPANDENNLGESSSTREVAQTKSTDLTV